MFKKIIPNNEIIITFARSSGAGGQNVNKISSKAILHWSVGKSEIFSDDEKDRIRLKLANKLNNEDEIVIMSEEERSQIQNRELAIERLQKLVNQAIFVPKKRKPTKPTKSSKIKRLESKKMHSKIKIARRDIKELL